MAQDGKKRRVAVVGVSHNTNKYGYRIFKDMLDAGYNVEGVNPRGGEIAGKKIYKNLADIKDVPDMVVTVVPPAVTEQVIDSCVALGIHEIWMQPGSDSAAAVKKAKEHGIKVTHNACIMIVRGMW